MAQDTQGILRGFSLFLVRNELLKMEIAQKSLSQAAKRKVSFISYLLQEKILNSFVLAKAVSDYFGLPFLDLDAFNIDMAPRDILEEMHQTKLAKVFPLFKRGKDLFVATIDPLISVLNEVKFSTGMNVVSIIVDSEKLSAKVAAFYETGKKETLDELEDADLDKLEITAAEDLEQAEISEVDVEDAPIVRFVNKIILDAIKKGASDIHFESYEKKFRVRFRIDGVLYEVANPPLTFAARVTARIKVVSNLNISERRIPQDGRFKLNLSRSRSVDFRISTCPTANGEKVVIRILDPLNVKLGIDKLGFAREQEQSFTKAIQSPQGMILVTGPTGSGKTITLYTALTILNTVENNISTAEDPVEVNIEGVNQVQINPKVGLNFATALRSFLRQDPDIIMIGEIRDTETAEIAIKAAQTGHLVLSTLHTNSAAETLVRLVDMRVERFDIASSVSIIIAQRLARKLCPHCKVKVEIPEDILLKEGFKQEELASLEVYSPVGCEYCNEGYKGRIGIFEVMPFSKELKRAVLKGADAMMLEDTAVKEGMITLRKSGLEKIKQGMLSLEELNRVIKEE
jgi:type IV pilus assembly protein PilB